MKRLLLVFFLGLMLLAAVFLASSNQAFAQDSDCRPDQICVPNPLAKLGIHSPEQLVLNQFRNFISIFGLLAIAFTVFSGFKLIIAEGEEAIKTARASVAWSVGGLIVALLSFTLVAGTAKFLGFDTGKSGINYNRDQLGTVLSGPADPEDFISVVNFLMVNFLGLIGFATTLMIIYYGYRYLTSAGNEESIEKAKTGLKWALAGLVVSLLAFTIISAVRGYLLSGVPAS